MLAEADAKRSCQDKAVYASKNVARDVAARIRKQTGGNEILRYYRCLVCGGFHLTRSSKTNQKRIKAILRNRAA